MEDKFTVNQTALAAMSFADLKAALEVFDALALHQIRQQERQRLEGAALEESIAQMNFCTNASEVMINQMSQRAEQIFPNAQEIIGDLFSSDTLEALTTTDTGKP